MSVVISIRRPDGAPLTQREMAGALNATAAFTSVSNASWRCLSSATGTELFINLGKESLWTDGNRQWLEPSVLAHLREVANALHARVFGEEGQDITVQAPTITQAETVSSFANTVSLILLPFVVLIGIAIAIVGYPWKVWKKITRRRNAT